MIAMQRAEGYCQLVRDASPNFADDGNYVDEQLLRDVKADHAQLQVLLDQVQAQLDAPISDINLVALASTCDRLRDQLAFHFTLKMSFGYLNDALEVAPRLCRWAEELQREQFLLFLEVCEIAEEAQGLLRAAGAVRHERYLTLAMRFDVFSSRLRSHDGRERDLIFQALCDDIGVGD